jgi:hypothetical protein
MLSRFEPILGFTRGMTAASPGLKKLQSGMRRYGSKGASFTVAAKLTAGFSCNGDNTVPFAAR